jgi:hypothetical protein
LVQQQFAKSKVVIGTEQIEMMNRETIIRRVDGLLAKANSSEHPAERESYEAKAQQLMTRYQIESSEFADTSPIDQRVLTVTGWGNATRGVVSLYQCVASLNRCTGAGNTSRGEGVVYLFGRPTDLDLTMTLVDYLLPQLRMSIINDKPRSRMSYALGFAQTVYARLLEAQAIAAAESNALVPTNTDASEAMYSELNVKRAPRTPVHGDDLMSGEVAATNADLGQTRVS